MAIIWTGYPIVAISGNFASGEFATDSNGVHLRPRKVAHHRKHEFGYNPSAQECKNHKWADHIYQTFTDQEKSVWRAALKAPQKSAYDLWMMECLTLFNAGLSSPLHPSISGGYSTSKVVTGGPWWPPNW